MFDFNLKYLSVILFFSIILTSIYLSGCASRDNSPRKLEDSTIIYPSKSEDGFYATITFSNKINKQTGKPINTDTLFVLKRNAKLIGIVDLLNYKSVKQKSLMMHIEWLDSTGNSFYKKRIDFIPSDSSSSFTSSISITPQKRKVGKYLVRVFLFRELIAEKYFHLVHPREDSNNDKETVLTKNESQTEKKVINQNRVKLKAVEESITANMILCEKTSRKTGKPIGVGTSFTIKEKAKVKAIVSFEKPDIKTNEQMKFYFNWIGPDRKSFYKKRIIYTTSNPNFSLSSSISISPEKRIPGNYKIEIVYKKKNIAEQIFKLKLAAE